MNSGTQPPSVLIITPARGGSKGIPRKNLRSLGGRPLISYVIEAAQGSRFQPLVLVSSEDEEILSVARALGAVPHLRPETLSGDDVTLDGVVYDAYLAASKLSPIKFDIVVTVQPTSPLIESSTIDRSIEQLIASENADTVLTAAEDRHLRWTFDGKRFLPLYRDRLNRQELPPVFKETGGVFTTRSRALRPDNRIGSTIEILVVDGPEAIDIDTTEDWALCEWHLGRREILFVVAGSHALGLGHAYNAMAVADGLVRHRVRFLVEKGSELAAEAIAARNYEVYIQQASDLLSDIDSLSPEVVINDRLDSTSEYVGALKQAGRTVINFEDLGPGARLADLVVNAIYPERDSLPNHYTGPRYYCARPEFLVTTPPEFRRSVQTVLITFGGTDPNDLTSRVLAAIQPVALRHGIQVRVVLGLGYGGRIQADRKVEVFQRVGNMAEMMRQADLVFTSAGRTTFEVACVGIPTVVIAQNEREMTHLFASDAHGFLHLGPAANVTGEEIRSAFGALIEDTERRHNMRRLMLEANLQGGMRRVQRLIEDLLT